MYYVMEPDICIFRNQELQAVPVGDTADHQMREPHWWLAEPWIPPPQTLVFAINSKAPLLDNYDTGTLFDLYSMRLIRLLRDAAIRFETFPATLLDRKTKQVLSAQSEIFHMLEKQDVMDEKKSQISDEFQLDHLSATDPKGEDAELDQVYWDALHIRRLELTSSAARSKRLMFRVRNHEHLVLVHSDLKAMLDQAGIT